MRWSALLVLVVMAVVAGCTEDTETGATCPMLCPGQSVPLRDTLIEPAYLFDTTLVGWPLLGLDSRLLLSSVQDSLDVRAVIRFDSLTYLYTPPDSADPIRPTEVDSVYLTFRVQAGDYAVPRRSFVDVYDVTDTTLADTAVAGLLAHFVPERFLGTGVLDSATVVDTGRVRIALDAGKLLTILQETDPMLRIGLRVTANTPVDLLITPENAGTGDGPALDYRLSPDTMVAAVTNLQPSSRTPKGNPFVAADLTDYALIAQAPSVVAANTFVLGGLPAARAYLRFNLPSWLRDSVGIVRVRLELHQDPLYGVSEADTVVMHTHLVGTTTNVTDLWRAATVISGSGVFAPSLTRFPNDSGEVFLDLGTLLTQWRAGGASGPLPPAIVFRTASEGLSARALRFFGSTYPDPALRPKLRVTYAPPVTFGRP